MPNRINPNDESEIQYGPDRDRPKDFAYTTLAWNHPLNVSADNARGTRRDTKSLDADGSTRPDYGPI